MRALVLAVLALLVVPVAASAMDDAMHDAAAEHVPITYDAFQPAHIDVLAGDTVDWENVSVRNHTVTAVDDSFSSPRLVNGDIWAHRFDSAGAFPYYCRLHSFMRGEVDVHELLLDAPKAPASTNRPYPITGRAALPEGSTVTIEEDSGSGFHAVATTIVGPDGHFVATIVAHATASYRAVAGTAVSPPVQLLVLDRTIIASVARHGRHVSVAVHVTPASPGETVVLQLRLHERFGWWPVAHARLDRDSRARFSIPLRRSVPARVLLTLPDQATALASTGALKVAAAR
jgi:plastocyanin